MAANYMPTSQSKTKRLVCSCLVPTVVKVGICNGLIYVNFYMQIILSSELCATWKDLVHLHWKHYFMQNQMLL